MPRGAPDYWSRVFSNFPTIGEGQVAWFQSDTALVGDGETEDLINYVVPDNYELHVCSGVVSCGLPRLQRYDLRTTPAATYISPTGHSDPDAVWTDEEKAYDGNTATKAYTPSAAGAWSSYLILTINPAYIDKIKFFAFNVEGEGNKIDVDVFYNGAWEDLYEGDFSDRAWVEKDVVAGVNEISKARVRFYTGAIAPVNWMLFEFQFNTAGASPQEGIYFDTHAIIPYLPQAPYIVEAGATFAVRVYNDDADDQNMSVALAGFLQSKV